MTQLRRVQSESDRAAYHTIRRAVLFEARGLSGYNADHPDEQVPTNHALLLWDAGEPVATVRLDFDAPQQATVRLVAVRQDRQGKGLGKALLAEVDAYARQHGAHMLRTHAARDAAGFYLRSGWVIVGEGERSTQMEKTLPRPA